MLKKTLAATVVAGALLFGGASAASAANNYPPVTPSGSTITVTAGATATVTFDASGLPAIDTSVNFTITGPSSVSFGSIVAAATTVTSQTTEPIVNDTATVSFTTTVPGTYTVSAAGAQSAQSLGTVTVAVAAVASDGVPIDRLQATGGEMSTAALWVGAGALGLGGLAVVAATARRRAAQR